LARLEFEKGKHKKVGKAKKDEESKYKKVGIVGKLGRLGIKKEKRSGLSMLIKERVIDVFIKNCCSSEKIIFGVSIEKEYLILLLNGKG